MAFIKLSLYCIKNLPDKMEQKGMTSDHDFYVNVGKQCRKENTISLYKLTNVFFIIYLF